MKPRFVFYNNSRSLLFILIGVFLSVGACAQDESDFYTPQTGGVTKNLVTDYDVDDDFGTDDSAKLQKAINDVSNAGGGSIFIPAGNYTFVKIDMKSNVRLEIDSGATIRPANVASGNYEIFDMGNKQATIQNVSIKGMGGQFKVDLRNVTNDRVFVFTASNVNNFEIANFYIYDKNTTFQSVGLGHTTVNNVHYVPRNGLIKNGHAENTNYGYGLVQIQAGENILFKDLSGTGGVTLRIETGWDVMNKIPEPHRPKVNEIYGRNISCTSGQAAVFLMPHTIDQGYVDIRGVTGISCEFAVKTEKGWVNETKYAGLNLTEGSFDESSVISDITAIYGDSAEVRAIMLRFIPCHLRDDIATELPNEKCHPAPACAPVGDFAAGLWRGDGPDDPGSYSIQISDIHSSGFDTPDVMDGDYCDYENCTGSSVWIPNESKNTIGECGAASTSIDSEKQFESKPTQFELHANYPNPFNPETTISYYMDKSCFVSLKIYNLKGQHVESLVSEHKSKGAHKVTWRPKGLPSGLYFYTLQAGDFSQTKKLVFQK